VERIARAALRECIREIHRELGYDSQDAVAAQLALIDKNIEIGSAVQYLQNKTLNHLLAQRISLAIAALLKAHYDEFVNFYKKKHNHETLNYILKVVTDNTGDVERRNFIAAESIDTIFTNWRHPYERGNSVLHTGIYQIFRRYKPMIYDKIRASGKERRELLGDERHAVICELAYVNSEAMDCVLVTTERNVYFSSTSQ
jgi:hypothetical protein